MYGRSGRLLPSGFPLQILADYGCGFFTPIPNAKLTNTHANESYTSTNDFYIYGNIINIKTNSINVQTNLFYFFANSFYMIAKLFHVYTNSVYQAATTINSTKNAFYRRFLLKSVKF